MVQENLHTFKDFSYVTKTISAFQEKKIVQVFTRFFSVLTKKINFICMKTKYF